MMPGSHIYYMNALFLDVLHAGVAWDSPSKMPGGHIAHMDTFFLHVAIAGA